MKVHCASAHQIENPQLGSGCRRWGRPYYQGCVCVCIRLCVYVCVWLQWFLHLHVSGLVQSTSFKFQVLGT